MRGAVGVYDIGICDDGEFTCSEIEEMLLQYEKKHVVKLAVHIWNSGEQLCRYLKNSGGLDLIFLDIELLDLDGIIVGRYIREELENRDIQIVYISCKPTSLVRDLVVLQDRGYRVEKVCGVDMFPGTGNVETIVELSFLS